MTYKALYIKQEEWNEFVSMEDDMLFITDVRKNSKTGRPLGAKEFIGKIEELKGVKLTTLPKGRPGKNRALSPFNYES